MVVGSSLIIATQTSDFAPVSSKEFLDIQATIECGFTLKPQCDGIYSRDNLPEIKNGAKISRKYF